MRNSVLILSLLMLLIPKDAFCLGMQILHIDFLVENGTDRDFEGVIWIDAHDIYSLIPAFDGFSFIVTTTNSPDLTSDLKKHRAYELPSQALDQDGDHQPERIGIYMSLESREKTVVTVHVGEVNGIIRLKAQYKAFCNAALMKDDTGVVWESDQVGYRYDSSRRVISVLGKMTQRTIIASIDSPGYNRSALTYLGREIPLKSDAPGFAGVGILENGLVTDIAGKNPIGLHVNTAGPLASSVDISLPGKGVPEKQLSVNIRYVLPRNSRWTVADVDLLGDWQRKEFVTGIPIRSTETIMSESGLIATLAGSPLLGLAVYVPDQYLARREERDGYHIALLRPDDNGHLCYAFAAYWELEHHEAVVEQGELDVPIRERHSRAGIGHKRTGRVLLRQPRMDNKNEFRTRMEEELTWMNAGWPRGKRISEKAMTYSDLLPPEAVRTNRTKSYEEALELMSKRIELLAEQGLSIEGKERFWITSNPEGKPRFIQPNHSWGDGYWVSMLWDSYKLTGDSSFRRAALTSNGLMLGSEEKKGIASGVNYWLSSVRSFHETNDPIWRRSALQCADTFRITIDPIADFPSQRSQESPEKPYHNEQNAIDAMMCVPILWWAYEETRDRKYLEPAVRHTNETIRSLIEPDGAVFHLSWYDTTTGALIGIGTNQGVGGNSRWARGIGWVLDGFFDAYKVTRKEEYLNVFRRSAEWLMLNLPSDLVPWYDFDDQGVFWRYRDTSTSAICAYGLLRMSELEPDSHRADLYREFAIRIVDSLVDNYLTPVGTNDARPPGMLSHQCYVKANAGEQVWGAFALMKSLLWLREKAIQRSE